MLPDYQLKIADLSNIQYKTCNVKKLVSKFLIKQICVLHYENLKLYLRQGLELKKHITY